MNPNNKTIPTIGMKNNQKTFHNNSAIKTKIGNIAKGDYNEETRVLTLVNQKKVSKVRVMGDVVSKQIYERVEKTGENDKAKKAWGYLTIDDSTGLIRVKAWEEDLEIINNIDIGMLVEVLGRFQFYNNELAILPDYIKKIEDPNKELLREIELIYEELKFGKKNREKKSPNQDVTSEEILEDSNEKTKEDITLVRKILNCLIELDNSPDKKGVQYQKILKYCKGTNEKQIKKTLTILLERGEIYTPRKEYFARVA
ncbi:MAG: OB-fold nucleic acid binding domain-containing protein [Candidatus Ranarchaeia archaeon]